MPKWVDAAQFLVTVNMQQDRPSNAIHLKFFKKAAHLYLTQNLLHFIH